MDIEKVWKGHKPTAGNLPEVSKIEQLKPSSSTTVLKKMKNALINNILSALLCVVLYVVILYYYHQWQIVLLIGITLAFTLWAIYTAWQLYRSVDETVQANNLHAELKRNRDTLTRWMQIQSRVALGVYPFSVSGGFIWGGMLGSGRNIDFFMSKPVVIWSLVICIVVLTPLAYYFAKWLFKLSFGKVIRQMDDTIGELNAE